MKRTFIACALGSLLLGGAAAAEPGADEPATVHVKALRNPEVRKYKTILVGLDTFEKHHALAPRVPELRFMIHRRRGVGIPNNPVVRIEGGQDFVLPLALDATQRFTVPRSEAALDAGGELVLNQKRWDYQILPEVRTPGLPDNVRRLGDLRLECKVMIALAKEDIPLFWVLTINSVFMTRDWCSFFSERERGASFPFKAGAPLAEAILHEGQRSKALETEKDEFRIGLADAEWSDEALVELRFDDSVATGTAGGRPRTAP
jgi:hypothetical protein